MNITVIGAGAIGGHIAAKLAAAGESVKVVARGQHLKAIRERGLILKEGGEDAVVRVEATDRIADAGGADLIVLAVKAHQLTPIAADIASIVEPATMVMTTQNGIPWWYFFKHGGPYEGVRLESVDPGGAIADHLPIDAVIAAISYQAAEIESPGVIHHIEGNRLPLAEIDGRKTERIAALFELFTRAGFKSPRSATCGPKSGPSSGQYHLQSGQRARPCDAGGHLPIRADARARGRHDAGGANGRRSVWRSLPSEHRKRIAGRRASARTRPRCCRTSNMAARSRSTRSWAGH